MEASTGSNGDLKRGVSSPSTLGDLRRRGLGDGFWLGASDWFNLDAGAALGGVGAGRALTSDWVIDGRDTGSACDEGGVGKRVLRRDGEVSFWTGRC